MLPKNLKYQNKVESASARAYSSAIQPQGGTNGYVAGNTITINIPTSPNTVLVPSECVLKFELAPARAYTSAIQPQNGTGNYSANNTITINIPTSPNTVLVPSESFLKFDIGGVTCGGATSSFLHLEKAGAHGVIQRLRITHGSQELENLDNYGPWVGQLLALQQSSDGIGGKLNILAGLNLSSLHNNTTKETFPALVGERLFRCCRCYG